MGGIVGGSLQRTFCTECCNKKALDTHRDTFTSAINEHNRYCEINLIPYDNKGVLNLISGKVKVGGKK